MTNPIDYDAALSDRRIAEAVRILEAVSTIAVLGDILPLKLRAAVLSRLQAAASRDADPNTRELYLSVARFVRGDVGNDHD